MAGRVYLDHNATTPLRPEVAELHHRLATDLRGNPSSLHASGRAARACIDDARAQVAQALGVGEGEVVFTGGATDANNLALFGAFEAALQRGGDAPRLVTLATEHPSVIEPARSLSSRGHHVHVVGVDHAGTPRHDELLHALEGPGTAVVSISAANGENGVVCEVEELSQELRGARSPLVFHTDAVQALGRRPLALADGGIDLASFSAHKVGGPPGVGILWVRSGTALVPRQLGGGQESGVRPGTENAPAIAAAALAIELSVNERDAYVRHARERVDLLWHHVQQAVPDAQLVGPPLGFSARLPNTLCVLLPRTDGRVIVTRLDLEGIEVSAGSACSSGSSEPSHVLKAMGYDDEAARSGLRMSVGWSTSCEDCKRVETVFRKVFASGDASRALGESSAAGLRDC